MKFSLMNVIGTERLFVFVTSTGLWFVRFDPGEPEGGVSVERFHNSACALTEHPTAEDHFRGRCIILSRIILEISKFTRIESLESVF